MDFKSKTVIAAFVAATLGAGSAGAANTGLYIGAGGGQTTAKASADVTLVDDSTNTFHFDKTETAWKGFVGYNFLPWLGVEAGYVDFGSPSDSVDIIGVGTIDGEVNATGWEGFLVGTLPIGPVDLFVKAGGIKSDIELKAHGSALPTNLSEKDSNGMWAYGGGIGYNIGHFGIRAEYTAYDVDKLDDLYVVSGSLIYRFNGGEKKAKPVPVAAKPAPAPAPKPTVAAAPGKCPDGDNDGVCDSVDQCPTTPAGARVGPGGCDCDYTLMLDFPFDSAELHADDKAKLDAIVPVLKNPKVAFILGEVDGYTDSTGEEAYNLDLSKRRAQAVADYMKSQGVVLGDRFVIHGYGEAYPVASNDTKEGRQQNRRVVLRRTDCGPAHQ
jgi:outer membrane protein OmpA-like peptidoglycan-associated protein